MSDAWNPITGCSVVSAGCKHCYAMRLAGTRLRHHPSRAGLTRETSAGPVWTGEVRLNTEWLDQPLHWRKARRIFVCAHGDLFHESVPYEWIDYVFAVMREACWHRFQVLTKRPARMLDYLSYSRTEARIERAANALANAERIRLVVDGDLAGWPVPNIHLGVSVEDQAAADERIPLLLQTPAAVRFISAEPLLGPINLDVPADGAKVDALRGARPAWPSLDWVIAGGESGPGARPSHPDWFQSLRDQCVAAGVPFFFKQWGEWLPMMGHAEGVPVRNQKFIHPDGTIMGYAGKRAAGRLLDGRKWNEFPRSDP